MQYACRRCLPTEITSSVAFHSMLIVYILCVFYCYYYCSLLFRVCFSFFYTISFSPCNSLAVAFVRLNLFSFFIFCCYLQPTHIIQQKLNVLNGNDSARFCKRAISNGPSSLLSWFHTIYFMYLICNSRIHLYIFCPIWNQTKPAIKILTAIDDSAIFLKISSKHMYIDVCIHTFIAMLWWYERAQKLYLLILLRNLSA